MSQPEVFHKRMLIRKRPVGGRGALQPVGRRHLRQAENHHHGEGREHESGEDDRTQADQAGTANVEPGDDADERGGDEPALQRRHVAAQVGEIVDEHHRIECVVGEAAQPAQPAFLKAPESAEGFFDPDDVAAVLRHGGRQLHGHQRRRQTPEPGKYCYSQKHHERTGGADPVLQAIGAAGDAEKSQADEAGKIRSRAG